MAQQQQEDLIRFFESVPEEQSGLAPLIATLDVGVSKTTCLASRRDNILDLHPNKPMRVLGVGVQSAPAMASGKPADFDACARAIRVAIDEASFMAGAPIKRVTASYSGPGLRGGVMRGETRVRGKAIADRDLVAALAAAQGHVAADQDVLHVEPLRYFIDDGEAVFDPVGLSGRTLAVEACIVTAPAHALAALTQCVRQAGAEIDDIVAGPLASGMSALTEDERNEGALLIDLGAGAMGVSVFAREGLVFAESIQLGGVRMTRDLAARLNTTFAAAERVKLAYGVVGSNFDPADTVLAPRLGADGRLESAATLRGVIAETLAPRVHEMLQSVRSRLAKAGYWGEQGPQRAVLVGGGAQLLGLREVASDVLGMPVRIGRPSGLTGFDQGESGPAFAAAAGLMRWRFEHPALAEVDGHFAPNLFDAARAMKGAAGKALDWLRENF